MNIVYLSSQTAFYGGEVCLYQLATGMRERGHRVACCVRADSQLNRQLTAAGISTFTLPLIDWFDPYSTSRLHHWLRGRSSSRDYAILHSHTPRDYYIAAVATLGTRTRNVGSRHCLRPIRHRWLKRPFLKDFTAMIAVSEAVREALLASRVLDPSRVVTVHNGIDTTRDLPARDGLRKAVGLKTDQPVIGYVGRLSPDKGVETLLRSVSQLVADGVSEPQVFVVGDDLVSGCYRSHLQQLAQELGLKEIVHFFGYVEDAAKAAADFDVQVVCSDAEPFGLVTLEGMAHRHPVVATATGGSCEIIRHGVDGFLVPPNDAAALAQKLNILLTDSDLRRRIGQRARARVEDSFSLIRMLDRTQEIYARVLAGAYPA